ncbi:MULTISPECIES: bifunctional helix-turn-helix transcriptional regulator/GNAT family N-acetyltransferase [unclassified Mesorhizobium]|uniref:bifunctional helix-turn-helix transcriptional regulator/GNAT family N-acetyltransferase n=1 Tax=unclassified Mesorhizobium TaxID=325217 RepID=UPI00112838FB|nr:MULTISPECIES: bifunctional helix-turn-helix transcriptional regulator/GNAT family N-acetyltransferase [unclassified Mesorhizobium]TPK43014.1 GNAT family N-acetyltransferase [Mesorhizobium sp. B2-5-2]TPL30077.1 GNAT family N-acetyltransferase [Mesorhizobium sp. B2-4-7]TPL44395.1 GNAT family N-acetyltransferase [Mesorhizobium sp. B2-4-5]TPM69883.1 GNAT family N-acetyltransferase [Mesorhizobium sp. B2-1-6]TPN72528.1 GNAT family N-acetyltransferase [Mesorhizobium sp. B1-1-2]
MLDQRSALVADIRHFNRFYTRTVGLLDETLTQSPFTLTEARVLFELGHRDRPAAAEIAGERGFLSETFDIDVGPAASDIARQLRLDAAYLTRILRKFAGEGLTETRTDPVDRRRRILSLTARGRDALAGLQAAADRDTSRLIENLPDHRLAELGDALRKAAELLGDPAAEGEAAAPVVTLRRHRVGDIGWVVQRQAQLYAEEYGWNIEFEALVAEIGADFIRNFKPGRDFCWIAERAGLPLGAVFLVHQDDEVAKLRLLHVEAAARGLGIGKRLVAECVNQARACGYIKLVLWTNDILVAARAIYERAGFRLVSQERHHSFGKELTGQNWELDL